VAEVWGVKVAVEEDEVLRPRPYPDMVDGMALKRVGGIAVQMVRMGEVGSTGWCSRMLGVRGGGVLVRGEIGRRKGIGREVGVGRDIGMGIGSEITGLGKIEMERDDTIGKGTGTGTGDDELLCRSGSRLMLIRLCSWVTWHDLIGICYTSLRSMTVRLYYNLLPLFVFFIPTPPLTYSSSPRSSRSPRSSPSPRHPQPPAPLAAS